MDLKRKSVVLSAVNGLRFALAFVFQIFLARRFGLSSDLDCLFVALTVFTFAGMIHLFLTSVFIPVFNEIKEKDTKDGFVFADVVLKWALGLSFAMAGIVFAAGDGVVALFASGFDAERTELTIKLVRLFLLALAFHSVSTTSEYILNALFHFSLPATTALLHPVANIFFLFYFVPQFGILAIAYAALLSNALRFAILIVVLAFSTPWRPTIQWVHPALPKLMRKSSSVALSGILWDLREVASRQICSYLPVGSVAIVAYSEKFVYLLHNIAVSPIAKVFFSRVSSLIAAGAWKEVRVLFERIYKGNTMLISWITANVVVFFVPLLSFFFLDSRFSTTDIYNLYGLMLILIIQVAAQSYGDYHLRILHSKQRVGVMLKIRVMGIGFFLIITPFLAWWQGIFGVAAGVSLAQVFVFLFFQAANQAVLEFRLSEYKELILKCTVLLSGMVIAGLIAGRLIPSPFVVVLIVFPVWNIIYGTLSATLMKKELRLVWKGLGARS